MEHGKELNNKLDQAANTEEVKHIIAQAGKKLTDDEVSKAVGGVGMDGDETVSIPPELPGPEAYKDKVNDTGDRPSAQLSSAIQCIRTDSIKSGKTVPDLAFNIRRSGDKK